MKNLNKEMKNFNNKGGKFKLKFKNKERNLVEIDKN